GYYVKFTSAKQHYKSVATVLFIFSFLFLQGCGSGKKGITIDSNPQGANVIADGKNIGTTPMHITQDEVFPPHWYGSSYMVKGELKINKDGCEGYSMKVNDTVLMNDITARLKCSPEAMKATPAVIEPAAEKAVKKSPVATAKPASAAAQAPVAMDAGIEERLTKLKSLRDKGVISADEYAAQRKRILNSL
ncbi:MAG: SHOCT domain-containing protein, partial [Arenicellales bacterium]